MKVFRVENNKGIGPIFGTKSSKKVWYDYRNNEEFVKNYKERFGNDKEEDLYGWENIDQPFDSLCCIIEHKLPRDNKPFMFKNDGNYRFSNEYCFGWNSLMKCRNFVLKGNKKYSWTLHKEGFYVVEYTTNDYIIFPDGQIAFFKNKAKIVKKYKNFFAC